ncbi:hypothetical protein C8R44DRAFT_848185 [Mycena epipterygia]|nr:hypothetical protein C8R44DRAFT_848185 [Mycena epipterygia]
MYPPPLRDGHASPSPELDHTTIDPRTLNGNPAPVLGEWKRSVKSRLQPKDKAYIRFLHANGVDEQEIVGESDWNLKTVQKAIKNDYGKPHLKISAAEAESHVCAEFHERLRAIQARWNGKHDERRDFARGPHPYAIQNETPKIKKQLRQTRRPSASGTIHPSRNNANSHFPPPPRNIDPDDNFVHNFLVRTSLEGWFAEFRKSGVTEKTLRYVAKTPADRADSYFAKLVPAMTVADRLILVDALMDLDG